MRIKSHHYWEKAAVTRTYDFSNQTEYQANIRCSRTYWIVNGVFRRILSHERNSATAKSDGLESLKCCKEKAVSMINHKRK